MLIDHVKNEGVTLGVIGRDVAAVAELVEVTFRDFDGVVHTVYAHKEGPWKTAEEIAQAWYRGELHTNPAEDDKSKTDNESNSGGES